MPVDNIVGVLPMAGSGSRLGLKFPKPLAPTFTEHGIKPLYRHSTELMEDAGISSIFGVIAGDDILNWHKFNEFPLLPKPDRGTATGTIKFAAQFVSDDDSMLVMLPDTIIMGKPNYSTFDPLSQNVPNPIRQLVTAYQLDGRSRMAVGILNGQPDEIDAYVEVDTYPGVIRRLHTRYSSPHPEGMIPLDWTGKGWGVLLGPKRVFESWDKNMSWAENIMMNEWNPVILDGVFMDLGTPERYMKYIDTRKAGSL